MCSTRRKLTVLVDYGQSQGRGIVQGHGSRQR